MNRLDNAPAIQHYGTPDWLFKWLSGFYCFTLDAAASPDNALCETFYTEKISGLLYPWRTCTFCNPPFRKIRPWVEKAFMEKESRGITSVLLLPNDTSSEWYRSYRRHIYTELLGPRFPYKGAGKEISFGSMLLHFDFNETRGAKGTIDYIDVSRLISL